MAILAEGAADYLTPDPHLHCGGLLGILLSFLYLCFYLPSLVVAQVGGFPHFRQPPLVRIVGTLAPLEEKKPGQFQRLTVHVKGKSWKLYVREITVLTATTRSGWGLLKDLFPPKLHFIGAEALLLPLQHEEIAGKLLELEGRLYVGSHQLLLSVVRVQE